jgi:hypothetical protein
LRQLSADGTIILKWILKTDSQDADWG